MKNLIFVLLIAFVYPVLGKNQRQIAAIKVNKYLEAVNLQVDPKQRPKSNSSRDFLKPGDAKKAEKNENAFNQILRRV
jgi:hypothetical protein